VTYGAKVANRVAPRFRDYPGDELHNRNFPEAALQQTLKIADVEVHVEGQGRETLVMVHGWPDTCRLWDGQVAAFSDRYRCVRFTLPGFDTRQARRAYSLAEVEAVYRQVIEQVSPGRPVILLVHDWGAVFGYRFVHKHPHLVSRLIGVDIGDAGSRLHLKSLGFKGKLMIAAYQLWLALAWRLGSKLGDPMTRALVRRIPCPAEPGEVSSQMNYPYWIQWTGTHGGYRGPKSLQPPCPMLFVYGQRKPVMFHSEPWALELASRPGSEVVALPAGHWVMTDVPQAFNEAVSNWLAR
jgi:pimeloyl-ACP methyl ester carboxylesterase